MLYLNNPHFVWFLRFDVDGTTAEPRKSGRDIGNELKFLSKIIFIMLKTLDSTLKEEKRLDNNFHSGCLLFSTYCMQKLTIFVLLRKHWIFFTERWMSLGWWLFQYFADKKQRAKKKKQTNKELMSQCLCVAFVPCFFLSFMNSFVHSGVPVTVN